MILVDTSIWADHLRSPGHPLTAHLTQGEVMTHDFVVGELACGNLHERNTVLDFLRQLPHSTVASHAEALELIEANRLMGTGLGLVDIHLLASARLSGVPLWTSDAALQRAALKLGIAKQRAAS